MKKVNEEIAQLKRNVFSEDRQLVKLSVDRLLELVGKDGLDFLISLLALDNPYLRDIAALALADIKDNRVLDPLLSAIFKTENHNFNGTLVFALQSFDCSQKLKDIFKILFYQDYESKIGAYTILSDQIFKFKQEDLLEIGQMWRDCKKNSNDCPCFDDIDCRQMMQNAIDRFLQYPGI